MAARNADGQNSHVAQPVISGTAGALLDFYSDPRYQLEKWQENRQPESPRDWGDSLPGIGSELVLACCGFAAKFPFFSIH